LARAPDERITKAYEMYKQGMKLVEIANQLNIPDGTVRRWKSTYKWDGERSDKKSERSYKSNIEISWLEIEKEYITDIKKSPCTIKSLSEKYNIDYEYLRQYSSANEWKTKREKYITNVSQKVIERSANIDAERIIKLLSITDMAASKAEQSLGELETYIITNKKKTKIIEYTSPEAPGKPTKEIINEEEQMETTLGPVDRQGLLFVTSSLKNIRDLYSITSNNQMMQHKVEYDNKKLEIEEKRLEIANKANAPDIPDVPDNDGFIEALGASAADDWSEYTNEEQS
jgi:transposase